MERKEIIIEKLSKEFLGHLTDIFLDGITDSYLDEVSEFSAGSSYHDASRKIDTSDLARCGLEFFVNGKKVNNIIFDDNENYEIEIVIVKESSAISVAIDCDWLEFDNIDLALFFERAGVESRRSNFGRKYISCITPYNNFSFKTRFIVMPLKPAGNRKQGDLSIYYENFYATIGVKRIDSGSFPLVNMPVLKYPWKLNDPIEFYSEKYFIVNGQVLNINSIPFSLSINGSSTEITVKSANNYFDDSCFVCETSNGTYGLNYSKVLICNNDFNNNLIDLLSFEIVMGGHIIEIEIPIMIRKIGFFVKKNEKENKKVLISDQGDKSAANIKITDIIPLTETYIYLDLYYFSNNKVLSRNMKFKKLNVDNNEEPCIFDDKNSSDNKIILKLKPLKPIKNEKLEKFKEIIILDEITSIEKRINVSYNVYVTNSYKNINIILVQDSEKINKLVENYALKSLSSLNLSNDFLFIDSSETDIEFKIENDGKIPIDIRFISMEYKNVDDTETIFSILLNNKPVTINPSTSEKINAIKNLFPFDRFALFKYIKRGKAWFKIIIDEGYYSQADIWCSIDFIAYSRFYHYLSLTIITTPLILIVIILIITLRR